MEAQPRRWPPTPTEAGEYESGAERLLEEIAAACEPAAGFPQRVEAGLRATLRLLAAEPELGLLLTVPPWAGDELALRRQQRWQGRFAELLRNAAARSPDAGVHPPFVEPALIAGIRWRISSRLLGDGAEDLEDLLPGLMEFVLACYFGPEADRPTLAQPGANG